MKKSDIDLDFRPEYWPRNLPKSRRRPVTIASIAIHSGIGDGINVMAHWSRGQVQYEADDGYSDHNVSFGSPPTREPLTLRELIEAFDNMTSTVGDDPDAFPYDVSPAYWLQGGGHGIEICSEYYPQLESWYRLEELEGQECEQADEDEDDEEDQEEDRRHSDFRQLWLFPIDPD